MLNTKNYKNDYTNGNYKYNMDVDISQADNM